MFGASRRTRYELWVENIANATAISIFDVYIEPFGQQCPQKKHGDPGRMKGKTLGDTLQLV